MQKKGCTFTITRGPRQGQPCGRTISSVQLTCNGCLCTQHVRQIQANNKYEQYHTPQINKPEETARTPMETIQEEELEEVVEAGTLPVPEVDEDAEMIRLLTEIKQSIKAEAAIKTMKL